MKVVAIVAAIVYLAAVVWALGFWAPSALGAREARSTPAARAFRFPAGWLQGAFCIHRHESVRWNWGPSYHPGQAAWNGYWNGYQFVLSTWQSLFTPAEARSYPLFYERPDLAPIREQTYRAYLNWLRNGRRWGGSQWPNSSRECGLA